MHTEVAESPPQPDSRLKEAVATLQELLELLKNPQVERKLKLLLTVCMESGLESGASPSS